MNSHPHSHKAALISIGAAFFITALAVYLAPKVMDESVVTQPNQPVVTTACTIGGCSGEICSDEVGMMSNCMYKPEFACYKSTGAKCERQTSGACGWTETAALTMCIKDADSVTGTETSVE